jgi:hypothetical protein
VIDTVAVILIIAGAAALTVCAILAAVLVAIAVDESIIRRRRSRQGMSDREIALTSDPGEYGVDISIWPARAPKNGSASHENAE